MPGTADGMKECGGGGVAGDRHGTGHGGFSHSGGWPVSALPHTGMEHQGPKHSVTGVTHMEMALGAGAHRGTGHQPRCGKPACPVGTHVGSSCSSAQLSRVDIEAGGRGACVRRPCPLPPGVRADPTLSVRCLRGPGRATENLTVRLGTSGSRKKVQGRRCLARGLSLLCFCDWVVGGVVSGCHRAACRLPREHGHRESRCSPGSQTPPGTLGSCVHLGRGRSPWEPCGVLRPRSCRQEPVHRPALQTSLFSV